MTRVVKLRTRLRPDASGVIGTARTDRRTPALLARLSAGDVAVLDQVDLDGPTADALVEAGVVAVLNRSEMISGRFPNRGPQILVDAGIAMVDQLGATGGRDPLSATGDGLDVVHAAGLTADVVVLDSRTEELPPARSLRAARDVVVTEPPGTSRGGSGTERFERVGVRIVVMQTTASPADAALLLADGAGARPIVAVGLRGTIEEFLDTNRDGLGSGYVTRLKVGPKLVDATAVPMLYSGQLRARHAYLVLLIGLIAVAAAIATTQVGHQWALDLRDQVEQLVSDLRGRLS
jgi:uncharacterized membrane-anchored protein